MTWLMLVCKVTLLHVVTCRLVVLTFKLMTETSDVDANNLQKTKCFKDLFLPRSPKSKLLL